jgi:predicted house-cleaning noncanonical NTP pyrophosphatase (MazG superfamily)
MGTTIKRKKLKKIFFDKLIRDKIPERISESGGKYLCRKLNEKVFTRELLKKVAEEADGLVTAKGRKGIIDELGDVLDVVDEIKYNAPNKFNNANPLIINELFNNGYK